MIVNALAVVGALTLIGLAVIVVVIVAAMLGLGE